MKKKISRGQDMTSTRAPRGGLFQDEAFIIDELEGSTLERLVGLVDSATNEPWVVFLKASGHFWQRFFLDAGLGFWAESSEDEVADELDEDSVVDYGRNFGIVGLRVGRIRCESGTRIRVAISSGDLILETAEQAVLDGPSRVRFEPRGGAERLNAICRAKPRQMA